MSTGRSLAGVVTPIYLALQGFSAFELAEYVMVVAFASALLSAGIGLLSDQVGRRPFLVFIPILTAGAGVAFAFTDSTPVLFLTGALGSFGRGAGAGAGAVGPYQPAESAFVMEGVVPRHRNAAFGRLAFSSSLGATAGGLLALLVHETHVHGTAAMEAYRPVFLAIATASALAGLLALGLAETGGAGTGPLWTVVDPGSAVGEPARAPGRARRWQVRLPRRSWWLLWRLWVTNTVNGIAVGMFGPFITYWFFRRFDAGPDKVGVLFAVINVATMASTLSAAGLARRWGLVRTITVVRTLQAVLLVPMVLSPSFLVAGAVYLVRMTVQRIGLPLRQSYAIALADPAERSSVAALSNVPSQLAMAASPLFSGYLLDEVSLAAPFEISAVFQVANTATFWWFFRRLPPEEELKDPPPSEVGPVQERLPASPGGIPSP
jgi:MFS family permease